MLIAVASQASAPLTTTSPPVWPLPSEMMRSISRLPSLSDGTEHLSEDWLGCEYLSELLDQRLQHEFGHVGDEFVEHAALAEQRVGAALGGVGLEIAVVSKRLSGGPQHGQQDDGEGADQPQAVPPIRCADMDRAHAHAEAEVLGVAEAALDLPAFGVEVDQRARRLVSDAGGQAPGLLHALGLHADDGSDWTGMGGDCGAS